MKPSEIVIGGLYRHYKGGLYRVFGFAKHTETKESLVLYRADGQDGLFWVRPVKMFVEMVGVVPRFEKLEE